MKKILMIVIVLSMFVLSACGIIQFVPKTISTDIPTQMVLPTYTPMPTYTPYPTEVPPTAIPIPTKVPTSVPDTDTNIYSGVPAPSGIEEMDCPNGAFPEGASKAECFSINGKGLGIIYFDAYGEVWGVAAAWFSEDTDMAYSSGEYLAWAGITHGWNGDDIVGAIQAIKEPDIWHPYGSVRAKITLEEGKIAIVLRPSGN